MRHQDLTINHILESWTYANAAARTGATGFVSGDVGRIAYQQDTGQYFRLTATTPTWALLPGAVPIGGTAGQMITKNTATNYDASWVSGPGTNSAFFQGGTGTSTALTPGIMAGFGAAGVRLTPRRSGMVLLSMSGFLQHNTAGAGANLSVRYGTGTAPAAGATATGSAIGTTIAFTAAGANYTAPLAFTVLVGPLTIGTQYWFDINMWTGSGQMAIAGAPTMYAVEL